MRKIKFRSSFKNTFSKEHFRVTTSVNISQKFVIYFLQLNFQAKLYGCTYNYGHNILRIFLIIFQIFFSSQVKLSVILIKKHGIYELPHELSNYLRLRTLGNLKILGKSQNIEFIEL